MIRRVGQREDDRAAIEAAHGLDGSFVEGLALRAEADDGGRLERLDEGDEVLRWRIWMGVGLLKVIEVVAARFEQAVDVEQADARPGLY